MRGSVVERVEVVVNGLHLRALEHREAEPEEDVFELAHRLGEHVQASDRLRRASGQRHVDALAREAALELGAAQLHRPLLDQRLEPAAHLVGGPSDSRPLIALQLRDPA